MVKRYAKKPIIKENDMKPIEIAGSELVEDDFVYPGVITVNWFLAFARKIDGEYAKDQWEEVEVVMDYFERGKNGVIFPDGEIYFESNCEFKKVIV